MKKPRHKYLERLVHKHMPVALLGEAGVVAFLDALDDAFQAMERDKQLTEHAFTVSEREYQEALRQIERENREKRRNVEQLEVALRGLLRDVAPREATNDLNHSVDLLRQVIERGKMG